jgi:hypothetical protein
MGYKSILVNQKTSLKKRMQKGTCRIWFDNVYYKASEINFLKSGYPFHSAFATLKEARILSDHIPIWFEFSIK